MHATLTRPSITILQPHGHLNASQVSEFQTQLLRAIESGTHEWILVDMSAVESVDSAGLMVFATGLRLAQQAGCKLGLYAISPAVQIIFELTQLDQVFPLFTSGMDYSDLLS